MNQSEGTKRKNLDKRFWETLIVSALVLCLFAVGTVWAEETARVEVRSTVQKATVFPDMARVTRNGQVRLNQTGGMTLDLVGLSESLYGQSFQMGGKGTAKVRILGASLERVYSTEEVDGRLEELSKTLQELQDKDRRLEDERAAVLGQKKFVESLLSTYSKDESSNLGVKRLSVPDWRQATDFVGERINALSKDVQRLDGQRRELAKEIATVQMQLRELRSKRGHWTITAHVDLEVLKPGTFDVQVEYLMPGASWNMVYDARFLPAKKEVEMGCYGVLNQRTGDDWSDVTLVLSTARPSLDGSLPSLDSRWVDFYRPLPPPAPRAMMMKMSAKAEAMVMDEEADSAGELVNAEAEESREEIALQAQSLVETVGFASFTVPRKTTVPSDNQTHKVFLLSRSWAVEPHYEIVPELSLSAFLAAKTANRFEFPLLAGEINLFMDDDYVGRASIPTTQSGQELLLPFGQDPRIKVERKQLARKQSEQGVINKTNLIRYKYNIAIENLYQDRSVGVRLLERIPVSRHKDIVVQLPEETTTGFTRDKNKPGILEWVFDLPAKAKKDVNLEFTIEHPKDKLIQGAP